MKIQFKKADNNIWEFTNSKGHQFICRLGIFTEDRIINGINYRVMGFICFGFLLAFLYRALIQSKASSVDQSLK